ncbi:MAG: ATP-binding cassette domain-containing protein [Streptosporangiales bacterium]|nr:ATP-binding cassette domain-containing protein [Streptosporangiales bacterium]
MDTDVTGRSSYTPSGEPLLEVDRLSTAFRTRHGVVEVINDVSFTLGSGERVALVGESGSGKSVTALSIMGLLGSTGFVSGGSIRLQGQELAGLPEKEYRKIRGRDIGMIFQDPTTCLDPVYPVGHQIAEALRIHEDTTRAQARARALELLEMVGIPDPRARLKSYQHELSGGQRQRVMIAIALACRPALLIADEPTTALDVTVQAQILGLLQQLQEQTGTALLLITHDLAVVAEMAERVVVMYAGQVVEHGHVDDVLNASRHPYTTALLRSVPGPVTDRSRPLHVIEGTVPGAHAMPRGCRFHPRCVHAFDTCRTEAPDLFECGGGHDSRCWLSVESGGSVPSPEEASP